MKKHLIAAAVAGALAVPAMAQVSVSGRLDVGYTTIKSDTGTDYKNVGYGSDTTSRLTFKANEDLGGGLKAGLVLEGEIGDETKTSQLGQGTDFDKFDRAQYVFISGGFGNVRLGFANTVTKDTFEGFSGNGVTNVQGKIQDLVSDESGRAHLIRYTTPKMGGVSADIEYSSVSTEAQGGSADETGSGYGFALGYSAGPLSTKVAYQNTTEDNADNELKETSFGVKYNLGVASVFGTYIKQDQESNDREQTGYEIGISTNMGSTELFATYANNEVDRNNTSLDETAYQIGGRYKLSKRTHAYLIIGQTDSDTSATASTKVDQTAIGLVHKF
jgi:predicted porin